MAKKSGSFTLPIQNILGISPAINTRSNTDSIKLGQTYHAANTTAIDLMTDTGTIQPGPTIGTSVSGSGLSQLLKKTYWYDSGSQTTSFSIENGTKIHKQDAVDSALDSGFGNFPITVTGAGSHSGHSTFVLEDIVIYKISGTAYVFASYNDGTDGDVLQSTLDGGTVDLDYMSTIPTSGAVLGKFPHKLVIGENGFMYITDGPSIHKFDGSVFTPSAIDLPAGWIIYDAINSNGFMWILAQRDFNYPNSAGVKPAREAKVFQWNYVSNRGNDFSGFEKPSPFTLDGSNQVKCIFLHDGDLHTFNTAANNRTQLRRFDGSGFKIIWDEPGDITPIGRGGIASRYGQIIWGTPNSGDVFTFGKIPGLLESDVFNKMGYTQQGGTGAIINSPSSNTLISSYNGSSTYSLNLFSGYYASSTIATLWKDLPKLSNLSGITLYYKPFTSADNSSCTVSVYTNFSSSSKTLSAATLTHTADGARGWFWLPIKAPNGANTNSIKLVLTYSSANSSNPTFAFYRIEIDGETTDKEF